MKIQRWLWARRDMVQRPLVVKKLSKAYFREQQDPFWAVKKISFGIGAGECFGLLGPNGAGKSTAMMCIIGFYQATEGEVLIAGIDVQKYPKRARYNLGVCSQEDNLDTDFTAFHQMVRYGTYFRIPVKEGRERANALLKRFNLFGWKDQMVEALSGGMRRRLQVARAWMSRPSLVILDEPTTGLDPEARREIWRIIGEHRQGGGAVLLSTHNMEEAQRLCDRVAVMHRGEILDCDNPVTLVERHLGLDLIEEEVRAGFFWKRPPNLEDVYLKLTGSRFEG